MYKLGLKVWSSNLFYISLADGLYNDGVFDYVELYVVPGSDKSCSQKWRQAKFPFILHAPHSSDGFNLSLKECEAKNRILIKEVDSFREVLSPRYVIFHPGTNGSIRETIRQISMFRHEFAELFNLAVVENKPKIGINGEECIGVSPEEIKELLNETGLGFCLDVGHAICYAAWKRTEYESVIEQFIKLKPKMFHLMDGDVNSKTDVHLNFGKGNFKLKEILSKIPPDAYISVETNKKSKSNLNDFEEDVGYLRTCLQKI